MDEILKMSIQEIEINMKKKGFSEIASSNDSETDDSGLEQCDEGFSDISSANDDNQDNNTQDNSD